MGFIPKPLKDACFRKLERFMIKAPHLIKDYSLKEGSNEEHDFLNDLLTIYFAKALHTNLISWLCLSR